MSDLKNCRRCGAPNWREPGGEPESCPECPPQVCLDCGEQNDRECSCWEPATQADMDELICEAMEED